MNSDTHSDPNNEPTNLVPSGALFGAVLSDRFQLSDTVLGSGSFGHAFLCYDRGTDPDRAPSCIAKVETVPTKSCFRHTERQLEHEHSVYQHLHEYPKLSKYLPKIHTFLWHQLSPGTQFPVLVMERAGKDMLRILMDEDRPYYQLRTLGLVGVQMVSALKYMHSMFVAHRDIKPQNITLIVDGPSIQLKLIDFGLSMSIPGPNCMDRDMYRSTTCTLAFASWRQHFRHVCSARTDMESFIYTWVFLSGSRIPWGVSELYNMEDKTSRRELIGYCKRDTDPDDLCSLFDRLGPDPYGSTLGGLLRRTLDLKFDEKPPYAKLRRYFQWLSQPVAV